MMFIEFSMSCSDINMIQILDLTFNKNKPLYPHSPLIKGIVKGIVKREDFHLTPC